MSKINCKYVRDNFFCTYKKPLLGIFECACVEAEHGDECIDAIRNNKHPICSPPSPKPRDKHIIDMYRDGGTVSINDKIFIDNRIATRTRYAVYSEYPTRANGYIEGDMLKSALDVINDILSSNEKSYQHYIPTIQKASEWINTQLRLKEPPQEYNDVVTITVSGEAGSGKSTIVRYIEDMLSKEEIRFNNFDGDIIDNPKERLNTLRVNGMTVRINSVSTKRENVTH